MVSCLAVLAAAVVAVVRGSVISGQKGGAPDPNRGHMIWDAPPFDLGIPTKSNIGGWCAPHGNVACILDEVPSHSFLSPKTTAVCDARRVAALILLCGVWQNVDKGDQKDCRVVESVLNPATGFTEEVVPYWMGNVSAQPRVDRQPLSPLDCC